MQDSIRLESSGLSYQPIITIIASLGHLLTTLLICGAETDRFQAAFLTDPVDNTKDSPESETSPSACKALQASGKKVAIMGAGLIGSCNPEGSNYKVQLCFLSRFETRGCQLSV